MGIDITPSTIDGGCTPICNICGVHLCYDIGYSDYFENRDFWEMWICEDCNGGKKFSLAQYLYIKKRNIP